MDTLVSCFLDLVRFGRLPMPFCGACGAKLDGVPAGSLCPNCQMKGVPPPPAFNPNAPPAAAVAMAQPVAVVQGASTVQQQMGSAGSIYPPPNSGQWSTGFCDCCAMVRSPQGVEVGGAGLCCKAFFCLCCVIGDNSEFFANHEGVHCAGQGNSSNACCLWCAAEVSACAAACLPSFLPACLHYAVCVALRARGICRDKRTHEWQHLAHFVVGVPLGCMLHLPIRSAIRRRYGLPEDPCIGAFALVCLQEPAQEYRPDAV